MGQAGQAPQPPLHSLSLSFPGASHLSSCSVHAGAERVLLQAFRRRPGPATRLLSVPPAGPRLLWASGAGEPDSVRLIPCNPSDVITPCAPAGAVAASGQQGPLPSSPRPRPAPAHRVLPAEGSSCTPHPSTPRLTTPLACLAADPGAACWSCPVAVLPLQSPCL